MIRTFNVIVTRTDEYNVEIDDAIYTEEWQQEFAKSFYTQDGLQDIASDLAHNEISGRGRFIEGYGIVAVDRERPFSRSDFDQNGKWLPKDKLMPMADGLNINVVSTDDYEYEVKGGNGMINELETYPFDFKDYAMRVDKYTREQLAHFASFWTPEEKAIALGITYEEVLAIKDAYEKNSCKQLAVQLKTKMIDRIENMPFQLTTFLSGFDHLPYQSASHFSKALNLGKIPIEHVKELLFALAEEWKELEP